MARQAHNHASPPKPTASFRFVGASRVLPGGHRADIGRACGGVGSGWQRDNFSKYGNFWRIFVKKPRNNDKL